MCVVLEDVGHVTISMVQDDLESAVVSSPYYLKHMEQNLLEAFLLQFVNNGYHRLSQAQKFIVNGMVRDYNKMMKTKKHLHQMSDCGGHETLRKVGRSCLLLMRSF